jgi:hypothetical protein
MLSFGSSVKFQSRLLFVLLLFVLFVLSFIFQHPLDRVVPIALIMVSHSD